MKRYKLINNITGWVIFAIAAAVYCMTIEPTASFWDCPEFILSGYKLEVGHPPGAPFFMLVANLFSQFTSDTASVAKMVNYMSALMSAGCILFLFWTITHLTLKLVRRDGEELTAGQIVAVMGSGAVGALAYTFSDTFWFSAVEGEVYAFSSLFTAAVFWLILKWEDMADQPHSDRWLVLIAYLTGLSIGVHLLNLLCLPAIVLVFYYKRAENPNAWGSILALAVSALLVGAVLYGIVPGLVKVGGWFELFFVNVLGMPFNSGVIVYIILLLAALIWGIYESYQGKSWGKMVVAFLLGIAMLGIPFYGHGASSVVLGIVVLAVLALLLRKPVQEKWAAKTHFAISPRVLNTGLLCCLMVVLGYSSYALIVIRSAANPPMDQNSPEDIFTLGEYLGREQYGTRPLFYGQTYASAFVLKEEGEYCVPEMAYQHKRYIRKEKESEQEKDRYVQVPGQYDYKYAQNMLFPRMYSSAHAEQYKQWIDIKGHDVQFNQCGEMKTVNIPTQWENIKFFFTYQLNWMYWRYFMWNFVGRQNDIQGNGELEHGNWITGFSFIDNALVGNQELLPDELKNNKGHNVFYGLPLLLGILGLLWQAYRGQKGIQQFWVVFFLFFMTGIAIVLYLNQTPSQPRERDYAYAGSFYAFAIWIGMAVAGIAQWLSKLLKGRELPAALVATAACLLVPIQMAGQTWDDHDRSGRFLCADFGKNYLSSLQEEGNPVIFTNGDNDTFPLWYNLEVEGFRTDARCCNLTYLTTDWYIDQMKRPAYTSPALPIDWKRIEYVEGTNDYALIEPSFKEKLIGLYTQARQKAAEGDTKDLETLVQNWGEDPFEVKNVLHKWVLGSRKEFRFIPTDSLVIKIDKEAVRRSGMKIPANDSIPDYINISLKGKRAIYKNELMELEMLSTANWERPLYMAASVGPEYQLGLQNYYVQEGLAYRFTPFDKTKTGMSVDTEKMYDNLMHKFRFGGLEKKGLYIDENALRMCYSHRTIFVRLAEQLIADGDNNKALEVLNYVEQHVPAYNVPYDYQNGALNMAEAYYKVGQKTKAEEVINVLADKSRQYLRFYLSLDNSKLDICATEAEYHVALLNKIAQIMEQYESPEAKKTAADVDTYYNQLLTRMQFLK